MSSINSSSSAPSSRPALFRGLGKIVQGSKLNQIGVNSNFSKSRFKFVLQPTSGQAHTKFPVKHTFTKTESRHPVLFRLAELQPLKPKEEAPYTLSRWATLFGANPREKELYLEQHKVLPPEGKLRGLGVKLLNGAFSYLVVGPAERKTFFRKGQRLLQNMNQKEAIFSWLKEFVEKYARADQKNAFKEIKSSEHITDKVFASLQTAVMVELSLTHDNFGISETAQDLVAMASHFSRFADLAFDLLPVSGAPSDPLSQQAPGSNRLFNRVLQNTPESLQQVARLIHPSLTARISTAPHNPSRSASEELPLSLLDRFEALLKHPRFRVIGSSLLIPVLLSILEKVQKFSESAPQLKPHLKSIEEKFEVLKCAIEHSPETVQKAFGDLKASLSSLPPVSIQGVRVYSGQEIPLPAEPPKQDDLLTHSSRPKNITQAKELTDITAKRFIQAFSGFSTVSLVNFFLDKKGEDQYDFGLIAKEINKENALHEEADSTLVLQHLRNKIKNDRTISWFKRFIFGSKLVLNFFLWFSQKIITASTNKTLSEMRSDLEHLKQNRNSKNMLLFELVNESLSNVLEMYRFIGEAKPGMLPPGSLETTLNKVSAYPLFYKGLTKEQIKTKVADKVVSSYLPRVELEEGYLKLIKGVPGETFLKALLPVVKLLDFFPNKLMSWLSNKLLKETDAVGIIMGSVTTKRNRSTQLELTILRSLREELADAYTDMQKNQTAKRSSSAPLHGGEIKEIQALCNHINKLRRLKGFTTSDQVRSYMSNPPAIEKVEEFLIDKNKEVLNELFMSIYSSVTDDISIETQLKSVFETSISSLKSNDTDSQETIQSQIASEKGSIDRLLRSILEIAIDRGIDTALSNKPLQVESMENIQKIVLISSVRDALGRLQAPSSDNDDRRSAATKIREDIQSMTLQLELLKNSQIKGNKLASVDRDLFLKRLGPIQSELEVALGCSVKLQDYFAVKALRFHPTNHFQQLSLCKESLQIVLTAKEDGVELRNKALESTYSRLESLKKQTNLNRHSLKRLTEGQNLIGELEEIYGKIEVFYQAFKQNQQPPTEDDLAELESSITQLEKWKGYFEGLSCEATKNQNLSQLQSIFADESALSHLVKKPLEKTEVDISLLKDSSLLNMAKGQVTRILNGYMDGVIDHLTDPLIHDVSVKTVLGKFISSN
jgi:hypothetical protein